MEQPKFTSPQIPGTSFLEQLGRETFEYGCKPEFPFNSSASRHWRFQGEILQSLAKALRNGDEARAMKALAYVDGDLFEYVLD